jgi:hypothetical protein
VPTLNQQPRLRTRRPKTAGRIQTEVAKETVDDLGVQPAVIGLGRHLQTKNLARLDIAERFALGLINARG